MFKLKNQTLLRKVPEITIYFWAIKLLTTAMGEVTSDFLTHTINPIYAVAIGALLFFIAISIQLYVRRYYASIYWFAVSMVAVFGTMAADVVHIVIGIPYIVSTVFFSTVLAVVFVSWYYLERTLSIHSITSSRRELFYWASVITTFALGTAAGDMTASTLRLGYLASGFLFILLILIPVVLYFKFQISETFTFWFAYILTRPLGASFADWLGKPSEFGGLGIGTGVVSLILMILIVILVWYTSNFKTSLMNKITGK